MTFDVNITEDCNLNCKYCFEGDQSLKKKRYMQLDMVPHLVDYIQTYAEINNYKKISISLNGGECLMNMKVFKEIVTSFKNLNSKIEYDFECTTNGTLLDDEKISFIEEHNIHPQVSIDGNKESHDYNRVFIDGRGSYDDIMNNISKLGFNKVSISYVVTPETVQYLFEGFSFLLSKGCLFYNIAIRNDCKWEEKQLIILRKQLNLVCEKYKEIFTKKESIYVSFIDSHLEILIDQSTPFWNHNCSACHKQLSILPNGDILPCGVFIFQGNDEFIMGNIKDKRYNFQEYEKVYDSKKMFNETNSECKKCKINDRCQPVCYATNYSTKKNIYSIPEVVCSINKSLINSIDLIAFDLLDKKSDLSRFYYEKKFEVANE